MFAGTVISNDRGHLILFCDDGSFIKIQENNEHQSVPGQRLQIGVDKRGEFYIDARGGINQVPALDKLQRESGVVVKHSLSRGVGYVQRECVRNPRIRFTAHELEYDLLGKDLMNTQLSFFLARIKRSTWTAIMILVPV